MSSFATGISGSTLTKKLAVRQTLVEAFGEIPLGNIPPVEMPEQKSWEKAGVDYHTWNAAQTETLMLQSRKDQTSNMRELPTR